MIIGTSGSRVIKRDQNDVRRRTLLEVAKGDDSDNDTDEATTRRRTKSDIEPMVFSKDIKMEDINIRKKGRTEGQRKSVVRHRDVPSKIAGSSFKMPEVDFRTAWINVVSERDVKEITATQRQTLRKFEETNEMLRHFNLLSESTFIELQKQYQSHVQLLCSLKSDLEQIFRRLRSLKEKTKEKYPEAVQATNETVKMLEERMMMEMEHDVPKYGNFDKSNTSAQLLPTYSSNPDTLTGKRSITDSDEISLENQFVQNDNLEENEHDKPGSVGMSNSNLDCTVGNETECFKSSSIVKIGLQEGNTQFDELRMNVASRAEHVAVNKTKEDIESNLEILSEKTNELHIKAKSFGEEEILVRSISNEAQPIKTNENIRISCQKGMQEMATHEQAFDSEFCEIDDSISKHEKEIKTIDLSRKQEEDLAN